MRERRERKTRGTYDDKTRGDPNRTDDDPPSIASIHPLHIPCQNLKSKQNHKENNQARQLHRQPSNQHILPDLHRIPLPIIRARYPGTRHLDQEGEDIARDEDFREVLEWDSEDVRRASRGREDASAEAREKQVVARRYEQRS